MDTTIAFESFTFEFHDEVHTSHPEGIEVTYNVTAQAVKQYEYCPLHDCDVFNGVTFDILCIEYNGRYLPVSMPREDKFPPWIERVQDKARDVYERLSSKGIKISVHEILSV